MHYKSHIIIFGRRQEQIHKKLKRRRKEKRKPSLDIAMSYHSHIKSLSENVELKIEYKLGFSRGTVIRSKHEHAPLPTPSKETSACSKDLKVVPLEGEYMCLWKVHAQNHKMTPLTVGMWFGNCQILY